MSSFRIEHFKNLKTGFDGIQLFFRQYTIQDVTEPGLIITYFEFFDNNNEPIFNSITDNKNIWNVYCHYIDRKPKIYYNFVSGYDIPENQSFLKYKFLINPNKKDLEIQINYIKLSLVLDQTKLRGKFTDSRRLI